MENKISFLNFKIKNIEGEEIKVDINYKELANIIYNTTRSLDDLDFAMELNKTGEISNVTPAFARTLKKTIQENYIALIQAAVNPLLDAIINSEGNTVEIK